MPPSKKPGWVNWRSSVARAILLEDLESGGILHGYDKLSAEEVWQYYKTLPEFKNIALTQFKARLEDHRGQSYDAGAMAGRDEEVLKKCLASNPKQTHNQHGQPIFNGHPAQDLIHFFQHSFHL
jgi:hypothetical protein